MYDWESNANTVIGGNELTDTVQTEDYKTAKECSSLDSSISDHWLSIVGRVKNGGPMLEDEPVPDVEFECESSPEKDRFASFNYTMLSPEPKWKQVSDESFVKMEQLVMSPLQKREAALSNKRIDFLNDSNLIVFSPLAKSFTIEKDSKSKATDKYLDISKGEDKYYDISKGTDTYLDTVKYFDKSESSDKCSEMSEDMDNYLNPSNSKDKYFDISKNKGKYMDTSKATDKYLDSSMGADQYLQKSKSAVESSIGTDEYLETSRGTDQYLKTSKGADQYLKTSKGATDQYLETSRSTDQYLETSRGTDKYLESSRGTVKYLETPTGTNQFMETSRSTDKYLDISKGTDKYVDISKAKDSTGTQSDDKYDTCDSYESNTESRHTQEKSNVCNNTLEDLEDYSAEYEGNSKGDRRSVMVDNSLCSSENSAVDESLKFNDTLEEMDYLIKYGMNYDTMSKQEKKQTETKKVIDNITRSLSPAGKKKSSLESKENKFKLKSPRFIPPSNSASNVSPFKVPSKKRFFYNTPPATMPSRLTPSKSTSSLLTPSKTYLTPSKTTPSKYDNILSPVQYYIKNSPVVPKFKNVSPGINLWEKHAQREASKGESIKVSWEASSLQEKAYKSSTLTRIIETPPEQRLPKNFRVGLMAESLPKPMVIKHERREKASGPLREQNYQGANPSRYASHNVDESFANLALTTGDVSLCIQKSAVRTNTLK